MALYEREQSFEQCMAIADRIAGYGQFRLAYEQLKACGAVEGEWEEAAAGTAAARFITVDELDEKLDRLERTMAAK